MSPELQSVCSADDDYEVTPHPQEGSIHVLNNKNDPKITVEIMLTSPVVREPLAESAGAGKYFFSCHSCTIQNTVILIMSI
jgi:hypothetical protein